MELTRTKKPEPLYLDVVTGLEGQRALETLLNRSFQVAPGASFYDDFPVWDEANGAKLFRVGVFNEAKEVVSAAGARLTQLKTPSGELSVGLIGGVVTSETHRGMGLASQTVKYATQWLEEQGASLILLWGSEHGLYQRLGFELCGMQVRVPLSSILAGITPEKSPEKSKVTRVQGWPESVFSMMKNRPYGLSLGASEKVWLSKHKNVSWYLLGDAKDPSAYAALGRGLDLGGLIHEWGGEPDDLKKLLATIEAEHPGAELLGSSFLMQKYKILFDPQKIEYLCLAKVTNPKAVLNAFEPLQNWEITGYEPNEWAQILFGPHMPGQHLGLPQFLPLPLWVWGLDGA